MIWFNPYEVKTEKIKIKQSSDLCPKPETHKLLKKIIEPPPPKYQSLKTS